jgi:anaphase-promoting complex subunit 2
MIIPWLLLEVFGIDRTVNHDMDHHHPFLKGVHDYVHMMVVQTYWSTRLSEIFDIITSYPDSLPAILDLKYVFHLYAQQMSRRSNNRCTTTTAAEAAKEGKQALRLPPQDQYQCYEQLLQELSSSLRYSFMVRLNHPGANTTQMIDVYIAAIQVLRILLQNSNHPTTELSSSFSMSAKRIDTVIAYITEPVRSYLRHYRNDTVRCILTNLTNTASGGSGSINAANPTMSSNTDSTNSNHVLYHELRRQDTKPLEYMTMDSDDEDDDEEECPTMDWQPRPSIYTHNASRHPTNRGNQYHRSGSANTKNDSDSDILAMLVSIYGSKELFVNEYRSMLADKLLGRNYDNNTDQDIHTLELLKLRFGELSLVNAEVMIKDIEDSARINKNIRDSYISKKKSTTTSSTDIVVTDAAIVSHIFWPKLHTSTFKHHPRIQNLLDEYATIYAEQKNPRILQWYNHLGSIQLELDVIEERMDAQTGIVTATVQTKEFSCSPLLATLISHFEDEPIWTTEQLSNETNLPDHIIVKQMSYWVTNRVVQYTTPTAESNPVTTTMSSYDTSKIIYALVSQAEQNESTKTVT